MLNIVLFGPPGAGKGTQSQNIIDKFDLIHIATGDLFRKHMSEDTPLGLKAKSYINAGNLVPDEVVIGMVEDRISETKGASGYIFDGFPRTVIQAQSLDTILQKHEISISAMIALEVPQEELKARIKERAKTSGRVDDQDEEKINNRIKVYFDETAPVADFYRKQEKFHSVNGVGSISDIAKEIETLISSVKVAP
ncbi:MAG: adenylate kinase [Bacteroidota bacterium]